MFEKMSQDSPYISKHYAGASSFLATSLKWASVIVF
ncbi:Uncharacterised protein [Enterobacter hormaechei]|nr:Uncharacterised protein [Enterobacter hormaechei]